MNIQPSKIIQIVPQLPPAINGLGDYALNLARQLRQDFGIETHFLVGDQTWKGTTYIENFPITQVSEHSAANLLATLVGATIRVAPTTILLHYVGYGYARRGCPVWLIDGLQRWRTASSNRWLVTMFHEVYASSNKPWNSSFWLSSLQKKLAARLARLSDRCLTNRQLYAQILYRLSQGKQIQIPTLPVFSNIGEPKVLPSLLERPRQLVVFGSRNSKLQVYQQCLKPLAQVCQALEIKKICDIGVPTGLNISQIQGISVAEIGVKKAAEISSILLNSIAGFTNFPPPEFLAKSGIFAAYCAHGLVPILTCASTEPTDNLEADKHYWVADDRSQPISLDVAQAIADNAYAWYQPHSLPVQTRIFATYLAKKVKENTNNGRT